eukprot:CAMPEP_0119192716 /NCGR_PEP_ID=MMETSP1316-20130426/3136_1 /TAXON_ID=41880 /ORGANISM="Pycnococcus provasolii, Strain RCC2336" /LENGTH=54 /DNA_ID=CAMNT_0007187913 /DNA_START=93 /DNA_END=253 /DNA_ORIENTATION=-
MTSRLMSSKLTLAKVGRLIRAMNRFSMVGKERAERRSSEEQSTMASMAEQATGG